MYSPFVKSKNRTKHTGVNRIEYLPADQQKDRHRLFSLLTMIALIFLPLSGWSFGASASGSALTAQGMFATRVESPSAEVTLTVNSSADTNDINSEDGTCADADGNCTLRAAIQESNAHFGRETIAFDIREPGGVCPNLVTIKSATPLEINDPYNLGVVIDGYTQCGASANSGTLVGNAIIKIEVQGPQTADVNGFYIHSGKNIIRGLAIYDWSYQIYINGLYANENIIQGNFIGTNAANDHLTNVQGAEGVRLGGNTGSKNNIVGGVLLADRNIISGVLKDGVSIQFAPSSNNQVIGNYIGLNQDGSTPLPNGSDGVDIGNGAVDNQIGGMNPGERNVISGNTNDGVKLGQATTAGNTIIGNFIGVNAAGTAPVGNGQKGINAEEQANNNTIDHNIIVGNGGNGVQLMTVSGNQVTYNFVGVLPQNIGPGEVVPDPFNVPEANLIPMPNGSKIDLTRGLSGIYIAGGSQNNVFHQNLVAYHLLYGFYLNAYSGWFASGSCQTYYNTISDNRIYNNDKEGIFFRSDRCGLDTYYPNQNIQPPSLLDASTSTISGIACVNCTIELFLSDKTAVGGIESAGEGKLLVGSGQANASGQFSISVSGLAVGDIVSGTSTDSLGNTSPFAANVLVHAAPAPQINVYLPIVTK